MEDEVGAGPVLPVRVDLVDAGGFIVVFTLPALEAKVGLGADAASALALLMRITFGLMRMAVTCVSGVHC